jgi:hypothetical protein
MPIAIWYPADTRGAAPLQLRDYVAASDVALSGRADPAAAVTRFAGDMKSRAAAAAPIDRLLDVSMFAVRDAAPQPGRFPLVLFAHASPETQSIMSEYLASHGFVVAGIRSRAALDLAYRLSRENLDVMVADLGFVWSRMQQEPNVRPGAAGVIGMSNGSIGAVALQLKAPVVAGVVSLDGGIGEDAGGQFLQERSGGDLSRLRTPILHFYSPGNQHLNLAHLQSYQASTRILVFVRGMRHQDFLNYAMFNHVVPGIDSSASEDARPGFEWVTQYTRRFLDALLNTDTASGDWLMSSPESHGVPAGLFTVQRLSPGTAGAPQTTGSTPVSVLQRYIQAIGGDAAIRAVKTQITEGQFDNGRGLKTLFKIIEEAPNRRVTLIGPDGIGSPTGSGRGYDGVKAWDKSFIGTGLRVLGGRELGDAARDADMLRPLHLLDDCSQTNLATSTSGDVLSCDSTSGGAITNTFDRRTGLLISQDIEAGSTKLHLTYDDYRAVGALRLPFKRHIEVGGVTIKYDAASIRLDQPVDRSVFEQPKQ